MNEKGLLKIRGRQKKQKELILENLKKIPLVQLACEKGGISRATFYRWVDNSTNFAKEVELASQEGNRRIGELAESKLIKLIQNDNLGAIIFYLKSHHKKYRPGVVAEIKPYDPETDDDLSEKEKEQLRKIVKASQKSCKECEEKREKEYKKIDKKYEEKK